MSIDARISCVQWKRHEKEIKLVLEGRPCGSIAGQESLMILNIDQMQRVRTWQVWLMTLVGRDIWGGSCSIMFGDSKLATRIGYTGIKMVGGWEKVIEAELAKGRV